MIISREFVEALDAISAQWTGKQFKVAEDLYNAIDQLHAFAEEHRELDYVQIPSTDTTDAVPVPDATAQPVTPPTNG